MKKLGLLGGMSWESTAEYYRIINQQVGEELGGLHSADLILRSVDFEEIEKLQHEGEWERLGILLSDAAYSLEKAGAEGLILCTNTMHKVAQTLVQHLHIPFLHIADATAEKLLSDKKHKVGLLGTAFTMEESFYKERLSEKFGLEVIIPKKQQREEIHRVIYSELCLGITEESSRNYFAEVIRTLKEQGAEAVILGCTEIGMLISAEESVLPLYDTTDIHARAAVSWMLS